MCHSVLPVSRQEEELLSRPGSVSPDDASDTSVSEATDYDVDGPPDDCLGRDLAGEEATASPTPKERPNKEACT